MGVPDYVSMDVEGCHSSGVTIGNRSPECGAAGKGVLTGLETIAGKVGIPAVSRGMTTYNTNHVLDDANNVGAQVETAGGNVRYTAAFHRNEDETLAQGEQPAIAGNEELSARINGGIVQL